MSSEQQSAPHTLEAADAQRAARVGSFSWDVPGDEVLWSEELYNIHGLDPSQFDGTFGGFVKLVHPEDVSLVRHSVAEALRHPGPFQFDHRIVRPDGNIRTIHSQGDVEKGRHGRPRRLIGTCWDVTEPANVQRELERSLSILSAILDATEDGILVVDRSGRVAAYNQRLIELWRVPEELAARRDDEALLAFASDQLEDPEAFMRKVRELYDERPEAESRGVLRFKDGRVFRRYTRPHRIAGDLVGHVHSFHDVTELHRALAAREEFLAIAAHEIRGPLMSIQLAVQSMREQTVPSNLTPQLLDIAERDAHRLAKLVDQLLDVGRLRAGKMELQRESVNLRDVVEEVVSQLGNEAARSGSAVIIRSDVQPVGCWDRTRVGQVVTNLLSNALKFGGGRPIDVVIRQERSIAVLSVTDRGIGIAPDALRGVFEPFERRVSVRHYGGLGLGLYIVKSLVTAMGGEIDVASQVGAGSTFTVTLPLDGASTKDRG